MIWDLQLAKRLQHGASRFELQLSLRSAAPRLVLFGPSGAGKSQTLKMIAGLVRPDRGHVRLGGRTLFDAACGVNLAPQARRLAYVFQDYALFPHLTVRQNIAFALSSGWRNPGARRSDPRVEHWLGVFQLAAVADHFPAQISGGQRQRTALARALVTEPTALLLDEPFAALDAHLRERLRAELAQVQSQLGVPMLLITHDEADVRLLADEVVQLRDGRVVDAAPVQEDPAPALA